MSAFGERIRQDQLPAKIKCHGFRAMRQTLSERLATLLLPSGARNGLKRPRMDGRHVTKRAETDKGRAAYIAPSSINPAMARRGDV
jgi:hypothetical protein